MSDTQAINKRRSQGRCPRCGSSNTYANYYVDEVGSAEGSGFSCGQCKYDSDEEYNDQSPFIHPGEPGSHDHKQED